jgi:hypothetical protein
MRKRKLSPNDLEKLNEKNQKAPHASASATLVQAAYNRIHQARSKPSVVSWNNGTWTISELAKYR